MNIKQLKELLEGYPDEVPVFTCDGNIEEIKRVHNVIYLNYESGNRYVLINTSPYAFSHLLKDDAE